MNIADMIAQMPINGYVVVGCLLAGWVLKNFVPYDNRFIPLLVTVLGAVLFCIIEGFSVVNIIAGALNGALSTGVHQNGHQLITGRTDGKIDGDGELAEENTDAIVDFNEELKEGDEDVH